VAPPAKPRSGPTTGRDGNKGVPSGALSVVTGQGEGHTLVPVSQQGSHDTPPSHPQSATSKSGQQATAHDRFAKSSHTPSETSHQGAESHKSAAHSTALPVLVQVDAGVTHSEDINNTEHHLPATSSQCQGHSGTQEDEVAPAHTAAHDLHQPSTANGSASDSAPLAAQQQPLQGSKSASCKLVKQESGHKGSGAAVEVEMVDVEVVSQGRNVTH
jgi:hypothetical protein